MANENPLGHRTDDKKVAENWAKIDWSGIKKSEPAPLPPKYEFFKIFPFLSSEPLMMEKQTLINVLDEFYKHDKFFVLATMDEKLDYLKKHIWLIPCDGNIEGTKDGHYVVCDKLRSFILGFHFGIGYNVETK